MDAKATLPLLAKIDQDAFAGISALVVTVGPSELDEEEWEELWLGRDGEELVAALGALLFGRMKNKEKF